MNDHTIYRGTGIQAAKSMIAWLKFALFKAKSRKTHFNRRAGVLLSQFKGKKCTLSLIIILDDSSCYLMIFMIL